MTNSVAADFLNTEKQIEFCCHLARGNLDPNEPTTYEYVKFVVDFKYFTHVPTSSYNGFESAIARVFRSANEEQICLVATVRLITPQFLKELCNVEEPCEEFTSRHSLEWKFLFLDHRAPPIIGYLPFEVLGTSGYDYYHADDLELLARCHEQLMQFGKGKSCYYRFLTKGQQWIWLQTHYYITYHQWNSKPEFIVCTHTVVSYAEVRAERRRDLGLEESSIELASSSLKSQNSYIDIRQCVTNQEASRERVSVSSPSSRRSSHTALSDSASTSSIRHTDASTPTRQSLPMGQSDKAPLRLASSSSTQGIVTPQTPTEHLTQHHMAQTTVPAQQAVMPVYHFPAQIGMMHQLKEQLEERTRILQADIKTQQEELHVIKEQLQLVQDSNLQMLMQQQPLPMVFNSVQHQSPRRPSQQQATTATGNRPPAPKKSQQQGLMGSKQYCGTHLSSPQQFLRDPCVTSSQVQQQQQQKHVMRGNQVQPACLPVQMSIPMPLYNNPMVFSQTHPITVPSTPMPVELGERQQQADYSQDRNLRFAQEQQGLSPAVQMQPITCTTICPPAPSVMIPHVNVTAQQSHTPGTLHQWQPQQVQPHHLYLQMQGAPESVPAGQNQRIFQPSHLPQQNVAAMGYFHHPQPQNHHLQGQPCGLQDLPEMQLP
ncbi:circadian clock protein PASD1 isoform X2 [Tiliqua scincoides]